jgi:hypothetical protein
MSASAFSDRLIPAVLRLGHIEPRAARALWKGIQLLSFAFAHCLSDLRADDEPLVKAHGEIQEKSFIEALLWDVVAILCERLDRIPDRQRPHYSPKARIRILRIRLLMNLSVDEPGKLFRVSTGTIERWQSEMNRAGDDTRTIGKTVKARRPNHVWICDLTIVRCLFGLRSFHIAVIERFWRTAKELLGDRFWKPLLAEDLEKRLAVVLLFYSAHRTHSGLGGATPLEVFTTAEPACRSAVRPPLATARDATTISGFRIRHLDPERRLPVLDRAA